MRRFATDRVQSIMRRLKIPDDVPIEANMVSKSIEGAQRRVEGHNFDIRKNLIEYDDVIVPPNQLARRRGALTCKRAMAKGVDNEDDIGARAAWRNRAA